MTGTRKPSAMPARSNHLANGNTTRTRQPEATRRFRERPRAPIGPCLRQDPLLTHPLFRDDKGASHRPWDCRFGSDADALGQQLAVVAGVAEEQL